MNIAKFYNQPVVTKRLQSVSGNRKNMVATGTYDMHIQRLDESSSESIYAVYGATHKGWTDITNDIKVGDQVIDYNHDIFEVVEITLEGRGIAANEHMELILKQFSH